MIDLSSTLRREALVRRILLDVYPGDAVRLRHYLVMR